MRCVCSGSPADTKSTEVQSVASHILLRLEHDNMDLGCKHAAQDHKPAQADRDTHGSGLDLEKK